MDVLLRDGWLSRCPPQFQRAVLAAGRRRSFAAKAFVYHLADPPAGIFGVSSGAFGLISAAGRTVLAPQRPLLPVPLSQGDLGEMANVSRQLVNATLQQWQQAGWISVRYGEVVVTDAERLCECAAE